jgi:hypothetical protein
MAVIHYEIDGEIVCGTKAKKFKSTINKKEVTCKRCKSKISKSVGGSIKVKKTNTNVEIICKKFKMKFPIKDFNMFTFSSFDGKCCMGSSIGFHSGQIKSYMKSNERQFFIDSFKKIKEIGSLTGLNVYEYFKNFDI